MMRVSEDRYLIAGAVVMIIGPLALAGYAYYFLATTYAQQQAMQSLQTWVRVTETRPLRQPDNL